MTETPSIRRVAVALFEGFTVLDVYGPVQAFASCRVVQPDGKRRPFFEIFTMARESGQIKTGEGPATWAEWSFEKAPDYDILLIPGGFGCRRPAVSRAPRPGQPPGAHHHDRLHRLGVARPHRPPRRPPRDVEQDRVGLGDSAGTARALETQGSLGRRRRRADLVRSLGGDRHGAELDRAPAWPGDGPDVGAQHGVRLARIAERRSVRVKPWRDSPAWTPGQDRCGRPASR